MGEAGRVIAKYLVRYQIDHLWKVNHIKILFLCSRNKWRSLTAEKIFHGFNGYEVRSAGTEENARIKVTSGHIGWADLIFVMEKKHTRRLKTKFGSQISTKKIICLDIPFTKSLYLASSKPLTFKLGYRP